MNNFLETLWFGIREPFKKANHTTVFTILVLVMFTLLTFIPVWAVAGNTITTQLKIFAIRDYVILILLSGLSALFMTMQVYMMRLRKNVKSVGRTVGGGLGVLFAGIAGTAFCASCLAPLFAIFGIGFGGVVFVLNYRFYFVAIVTLLMLIAIYLTARRISRVCTLC